MVRVHSSSYSSCVAALVIRVGVDWFTIFDGHSAGSCGCWRGLGPPNPPVEHSALWARVLGCIQGLAAAEMLYKLSGFLARFFENRAHEVCHASIVPEYMFTIGTENRIGMLLTHVQIVRFKVLMGLDFMAADSWSAAFSKRKSGALEVVSRSRSLDTFHTG